jgi:hypothetical protein
MNYTTIIYRFRQVRIVFRHGREHFQKLPGWWSFIGTFSAASGDDFPEVLRSMFTR